jgi:uncharacterized membrane protein
MTDGSRDGPELTRATDGSKHFRDGVFAVAVTIIALVVRVPDSLAFAHDVVALRQFATLLAIYALTFVVVGILWANHHYLIFTLPNTDRASLWLVARFFGLRLTSPRATAAYAFVVMMCTCSLTLLRCHASRISANQFHRAVHRRVFRKVSGSRLQLMRWPFPWPSLMSG